MYNSKLLNALISGVNVKRNGRERIWKQVVSTGKYRIAHDGAIMVQVQDGDTKKEVNFSTFKAGFMVYARESVPFGQEITGQLDCSFWFNGKQDHVAALPYNKIQTAIKAIDKDPQAGISRLFNSDIVHCL